MHGMFCDSPGQNIDYATCSDGSFGRTSAKRSLKGLSGHIDDVPEGLGCLSVSAANELTPPNRNRRQAPS